VGDARLGATRTANALSLAAIRLSATHKRVFPAGDRNSQNMQNDHNKPELGQFDFSIIRRKVAQITGLAGFTPQDRPDLEQDLALRVLQALRSFEPERAHRNSFVTAVVERGVATILRDKRAAKRDHRRVCSLSVTVYVREVGPVELAQTISAHEVENRTGADQRSQQDLTELAIDVAEVIGSLPELLQELAERRKSQTMAEIAEAMNVPRTTLNDRIAELRQIFQRAGLRDYL
jgi:RNA polymerase sigma-70 factor (ECF subfamily)